MKWLVVAGVVIVAFIFSAFCLFGVLATFEPTASPGQFLAYRAAYAVAGAGSLLGAVTVFVLACRG